MFNATNGDRPGVPNIGVVITDGASNDQEKTASEAQSARDAGILLLAVGIQNANMVELNAIATDPDSDHVFTVSNFFQLSNITASFQATTCTGKLAGGKGGEVEGRGGGGKGGGVNRQEED